MSVLPVPSYPVGRLVPYGFLAGLAFSAIAKPKKTTRIILDPANIL